MATIVCDGNGGIRVELYSNNACIKDCLIAHEKDHRLYILSRQNKLCANKKNGTGIVWTGLKEATEAELRGYITEKRCLESKLRHSCENDECRSEIEARIKNVKNSIRRLKAGTFF